MAESLAGGWNACCGDAMENRIMPFKKGLEMHSNAIGATYCGAGSVGWTKCLHVTAPGV